MDCETTGLEPWAKITELCLVAIQTEHLLAVKDSELPRALSKLNMCFNPQRIINPTASCITGLSNELLENAGPFSHKTVEMLQHFIDHLPQPACLVAHNGNKFDFPILRKHIKSLDMDITSTWNGLLSIDTLEIFRQHYKFETAQIKPKEEMLQDVPSELLDDGWDFAMSQKLDELDSQSDAQFLHKSLMMQKINESTPKKKEKDIEPAKRSSRKKLEFGNRMPSYKLGDVFERITGMLPTHSHEAESDVIMMAKCAAILGQNFVSLANNMARLFIN